jgi:hypothetical protein
MARHDGRHVRYWALAVRQVSRSIAAGRLSGDPHQTGRPEWHDVVESGRWLSRRYSSSYLLTYDLSMGRDNDARRALAMVRARARLCCLLDRLPCRDSCFLGPILVAAYRTTAAWAHLLGGDDRRHATSTQVVVGGRQPTGDDDPAIHIWRDCRRLRTR